MAADAATTATVPPVARVSRQPPPDPIAFGVAERYAKALTLDPSAPPPPAPPGPRRSRAAMRDRALDASRPERRAASRPARSVAPVRAMGHSASSRDSAHGASDRPSRRAGSSRASSGTAPPNAPRATNPRRATPGGAATNPRRGTPGAPAATPANTGPGIAPPARRTVTIRGRGAERDLSWSSNPSRRRPAVPAHERDGFRPDRAALWAVVLGLLLVLVAATSSHAAVLAHAIR